MEVIPTDLLIILAIIQVFWELPWKGFGLWKAAQLSHKRWFVAILLLNTFGILPIIYLRFVAKKYEVEIKDESLDIK
ncbi:MAG: hypothetical protein RJA61_366 [Candidatus Parcubacteria bacterium]|jgi:uncharacterized membrane protein YiaA